ncbi:MAG: hypothetical protein QGH15_06130 [Kiritimatiellia bacterium]|nr:hypothetical protein [Kiritimatiellia bacterium]
MRSIRTALTVCILVCGVTTALLAETEVLTDLANDWKVQYGELERNMKDRGWFEKIASQTYRPDSLVSKDDTMPTGIVLRRTEALLADLSKKIKPAQSKEFTSQLSALRKKIEQAGDAATAEQKTSLFAELCGLRRRIAFSNPLLDFDKIVFMKSKYTTNHCCDQYFGFNAKPGGGIYVLSNPFSDKPVIKDIIGDSVVTRGRLEGKKLDTGSFLSLSLSYDASTMFFAYTQCQNAGSDPKAAGARHFEGFTDNRWCPERSWHIFKARSDGSGLEQLTDGAWNEFAPCLLPNGRVVFISERRGGFGRCHPRPVPTYTLHSMRQDGSDIVPLSYHETNEWHPSVNHDGMIVYTRWDYVDRGDCIAHHPWITFPDGRDPRAIQGNYPLNRNSRPDMEMHVRAIPGSHKYIATAAGHHRQAYGSLVVIDPRVEDDGAMAPLKRLTPEIQFPETERGNHAYGTAWPLSEDYYLCVHAPGGKGNMGVYLVDSFGNKELIYRDAGLNCIHPIPFRKTTTPPVIPHATAVGVPDGADKPSGETPTTGTIVCVNVYNSLKPWPEGTKIKSLRVIQLFPKATFRKDAPWISFKDESLARGVLGTVPVEEDGSVNFTAPAGKTLYFQALDKDGLAVQSMMSATYVHPGENLTCQGCHEPNRGAPPQPSKTLLALKRAPSKLTPDVKGTYPLSFPTLVQPVLDKHCVKCHTEQRKKGKKPPVLAGGKNEGKRKRWSQSYDSLSKYAYGCAGKPPNRQPVRTTPGQFGAKASKLYQMLKKGHNKLVLPEEDMHRITAWLDLNSNFYGSYIETDKQIAGNVVMPSLE